MSINIGITSLGKDSNLNDAGSNGLKKMMFTPVHRNNQVCSLSRSLLMKWTQFRIQRAESVRFKFPNSRHTFIFAQYTPEFIITLE